MYVCVCNAVSDRQIREAVERGAVSSLEEVKQRLKVATCCGRCESCALSVLDEALRECGPAVPMAAAV